MDPRLSEQLLTACSKGLVGLVPLLLQKGASVNWTREDGWTPLMSACSGGHLPVAQLLLDAGASVDAAAEDGFTALMEACTYGHSALVELLLQHGACIAHAARDSTALILAALYGHLQVVELLLMKGADVRPGKFTALHAAAGNGQAMVVRRLAMEFFPKDGPEASESFVSACANGHLEVVRVLLQHGVGPSVSAVDGTTALMKACMGSHREVAAELIFNKASVEEAQQSARRRKMPGVLRVLLRAAEEAQKRSGTEARDLESLVRSVEGKAKARRSTAGSTSTAFAEQSEMGVASAFQASSGQVEESDEEVLLEWTGASWFKPTLAREVESERSRVRLLLERTKSLFPEPTERLLEPRVVRQMPSYCRKAFYTIEVLADFEPSP